MSVKHHSVFYYAVFCDITHLSRCCLSTFLPFVICKRGFSPIYCTYLQYNYLSFTISSFFYKNNSSPPLFILYFILYFIYFFLDFFFHFWWFFSFLFTIILLPFSSNFFNFSCTFSRSPMWSLGGRSGTPELVGFRWCLTQGVMSPGVTLTCITLAISCFPFPGHVPWRTHDPWTSLPPGPQPLLRLWQPCPGIGTASVLVGSESMTSHCKPRPHLGALWGDTVGSIPRGPIIWVPALAPYMSVESIGRRSLPAPPQLVALIVQLMSI